MQFVGVNDVQYLFSSVDYLSLFMDRQAVIENGGPDQLWVKLLGALAVREGATFTSPAHLNCYKGYATAGAFLGFDVRGAALVRLPGLAADRAAVSGSFIDVRPTRLDLQSTYYAGENTRRHVLDAYNQFRNPNNGRAAGRAALAGLILSDGATATSGKRSRRGLYLRVYEAGIKHNDVPELQGTVRYEAELTGSNAEAAFRVLRPKFEQCEIHALVSHYFRKRGLQLCQATEGGEFRLKLRERAGTSETTREAKLRWLRRQVAPTIARLLASGRKEDIQDVLEALHLDSYVRIVDTQCYASLG